MLLLMMVAVFCILVRPIINAGNPRGVRIGATWMVVSRAE